MSQLIPDIDLVRKYDRPGPRYTSYPTAPAFTENIDHDQLLADARAETGPLSLYFHLPFCESLCWFCGCNTIIQRDRDRADIYLDHLERELDLFSPIHAKEREVVQLHFGGGTPNFLRPDQIDRLSALIHRHYTLSPDAECSVELDPRRLTVEHVRAFRRLGMWRASFGVQDVNPQVQKAIHRIQPQEVNKAAATNLRNEGFRSVNIDLVYGLPHQTPETFRKTLDAVLALEPDRFAIFNYAHVPWIKPAQKLLQRAGLPDSEQKLALLQTIIETLTGAGYVYVGMDHFAKPDDELVRAQREGTLQRNFQGYSTRAGAEICAYGVSSISQTSRTYRQNFKDLDTYYPALEKGSLPIWKGYILSEDDQIRRTVIMRLMCDMALNYGSLSEELGIDFRKYFAEEISRFDEAERDGLVERTEGGLIVQPKGRLLIRNLAMHFDVYLPRQEPRFSRTI